MTYDVTSPPRDWNALYLELRRIADGKANLAGWDIVVPQWYTVTADSNPAIGNGTLEGWYSRQDDMVDFAIRLVMGSTTTFGTAGEDWRFAPPADLLHAAVGYWIGAAYALDSDTTTYRAGSVFMGAGDTYFRVASEGAGSHWRNNAPHTWATNDTVYMSIRYRVDNLR